LFAPFPLIVAKWSNLILNFPGAEIA